MVLVKLHAKLPLKYHTNLGYHQIEIIKNTIIQATLELQVQRLIFFHCFADSQLAVVRLFPQCVLEGHGFEDRRPAEPDPPI